MNTVLQGDVLEAEAALAAAERDLQRARTAWLTADADFQRATRQEVTMALTDVVKTRPGLMAALAVGAIVVVGAVWMLQLRPAPPPIAERRDLAYARLGARPPL